MTTPVNDRDLILAGTASRTVQNAALANLGYVGALNATANHFSQGLQKDRPTGNDGDMYFATDQTTLYQMISGAWVVASTVGAPSGTLVAGTDAATLVSNATTALTNASNAQTAANTANTAIGYITSDNYLSMGEKSSVIADWTVISTEKAGIDANADAVSVSKAAYDSAYTALHDYLGTLSNPAWNDVTRDTPIVGTDFRNAFANYYSAKQALLNAIAAKASTMASGVTIASDGTLSGAGGGKVTIGGLGYTGHLGATKNIVTSGATAPSSPSDGDIWVNTNAPVTILTRVGGAWVVGGNVPTALSQVDSSAASKLSGIASGATANVVTSGTGTPASNFGSNGDFFYSADTKVLYQKITGSWTPCANNYTDTNQLNDGAGLGTKAVWTNVSGTGKPQDNATVGAPAGTSVAGVEAGQLLNNVSSAATTATWIGVTGSGKPLDFRVVSRGNSQSAPMPASTGFYIGAERQFDFGRSYTLVTINRSTGAVSTPKNYDVYGTGSVGGKTAADLANDLNALGPNVIAVVASADEPYAHRFDSGMDAAMYRCGASRAIFGSSQFKVRSAYVLIGIPGCGEGNGAEAYQGSVDSDPNAWVDVGFAVTNGALTGVTGNYTPKSLTDYGYTGDLNATAGATLGVNVAGQITEGNSGTLIGSQAIGSTQISDLRTTNYAEDASGNPTSGAKMASAGTSFKVASNSFQVGTLVLSDYWFRLVQGIDGAANGSVIWRGNNDATTRGGAPNIDCLSVSSDACHVIQDVQSANFPAFAIAYFSYTLTPQSYNSRTDNLDAMQQIHVQFIAGSGSTSPFLQFYAACPSRTYDGALGSAKGSFNASYRSQNGGLLIGDNWVGPYVAYLRIRLANTYGWSDYQDFTGYNGGVIPIGSPMARTSLPNYPKPAYVGGGGSTGGACPAPWVKVRLLNGKEVNAGDLHNGACVAAVNDTTLEPLPKGGVVRDLATIWARRYRVKLTDGTSTEWSENHRFAVAERGWVQVQNLRGGDQILGLKESIVDSVLAVGEGQVVSFRVEGAGTYFAGGLLCHNTKAAF